MPTKLVLAIIALSLPLIHARPAAAQFDKAELKCRATISKAGTKLAAATAKTLNACHAGRLKGKVDVNVDCNDVAEADLAKGKVAKAAGKLVRLVADSDKGRCMGLDPGPMGYASCPAPCDSLVPAIIDFSDVSACEVCVVESRVASMTAIAQGAPVPPLAPDDARCHGTLGKTQTRLLGSVLKERASCQSDAESGGAVGTSQCALADPRQKIARTRGKSEASAAKACAPADLSSLDSCDDASVALLGQCVYDAADALGESVFQSFYALEFVPESGSTTTTAPNASTTTTTSTSLGATTTTITTTTTLSPAPTWTSVFTVLTGAGCADPICHGGAVGGGGGLNNLDDLDLGYTELLVDPVGCALSAFTGRVVAGDPDASFLIAKVSGTHDCGNLMPLIGPMLSPAEITTIRDWITAGALKN